MTARTVDGTHHGLRNIPVVSSVSCRCRFTTRYPFHAAADAADRSSGLGTTVHRA